MSSFMDNIDTSTFSFDTGGSGFNYPGSFDGAFSGALDSGATWVGDAWDSSLGFLSDGLNVYKDYLQVSQKGPYAVPAASSYDQWAEKAQPTDTQAANATATGGGQMIPGVGNGVLLLAGAALAVVLLTK